MYPDPNVPRKGKSRTISPKNIPISTMGPTLLGVHRTWSLFFSSLKKKSQEMLEKDLDFYTRHGLDPNPQWEPTICQVRKMRKMSGGKWLSLNYPYIYLYIYLEPKWPFVLVGKGLVLEGWPSKIEVSWILGIWVCIFWGSATLSKAGKFDFGETDPRNRPSKQTPKQTPWI